MDQIFIQVASYCDRLLIRTVNVALKRAKHPKRLRFGICIQDNPKRFKKLLNELPKTSSILLWNCDKSQGVGWARSQAQSLLKNEQYTLQIDAHMDFALNWDYLLIKMWEKCNNEKAIFSQLCHGWQGIPKKELILQEPRTCGIKTQWYKDCFGVGWGISAAGKAPVRQAFTCAHMVFAPSDFFNQVPIDPKIGYAYEENALDVRTWTHGWDVYCPNQNVIRHGYYNDAVQMDLGKFWALNAISHKRWRRLIGLNPTPLGKKYGLGTKRTMSDFVRFSGMDFVAHKATKEAHLGLVNNSYLS